MTDDLDTRIAEMPIVDLIALVDDLDPAARLVLEAELAGKDGVASQMTAIALKERRVYGSDFGEVVRAIQSGLRLGPPPAPVPERIRALRPNNRRQGKHAS